MTVVGDDWKGLLTGCWQRIVGRLFLSQPAKRCANHSPERLEKIGPHDLKGLMGHLLTPVARSNGLKLLCRPAGDRQKRGHLCHFYHIPFRPYGHLETKDERRKAQDARRNYLPGRRFVFAWSLLFQQSRRLVTTDVLRPSRTND